MADVPGVVESPDSPAAPSTVVSDSPGLLTQARHLAVPEIAREGPSVAVGNFSQPRVGLNGAPRFGLLGCGRGRCGRRGIWNWLCSIIYLQDSGLWTLSKATSIPNWYRHMMLLPNTVM